MGRNRSRRGTASGLPPCLILTPHIAADDRDRYNDVTLDIAFENIRAYASGRTLPNQIDPSKDTEA